MSPATLKAALRAFAARHRAWPLVLLHRALWYLGRRLFGPRTFTFQGRSLPYRVHPFILDNERTVEIPLALDAVERLRDPNPRILEVGNVLAAYADFERTVVDKYERAPGVLNVDILDYRPAEPFDLILCLSTLEHIGHDEEPRDPGKALRALDYLKTLLAPGGELLVTVPVGYHPDLDRVLASRHAAARGSAGPASDLQIVALERHGRFNRWRECPPDVALARPFASKYSCANGLVAILFRSDLV
ncbi:MAG: hypothetical protein AAGM22_20880 [Acidobacteriota bacterium]